MLLSAVALLLLCAGADAGRDAGMTKVFVCCVVSRGIGMGKKKRKRGEGKEKGKSERLTDGVEFSHLFIAPVELTTK